MTDQAHPVDDERMSSDNALIALKWADRRVEADDNPESRFEWYRWLSVFEGASFRERLFYRLRVQYGASTGVIR